MPIHLRPPVYSCGGPDGQGSTRFSIGSLAGDECALRPQGYSHLVEAQDTRRAGYGGYGPCIRDGRCQGCPIFEAPLLELRAMTDRVLVRIDGRGEPWLMNRPEDGWASLARRWTWADLRRIDGWTVGRRITDEHGDGFWLTRVDPTP